MAEQFSNAPAPSREEFEDLAEQIGSLIQNVIHTASNIGKSSNTYVSNINSYNALLVDDCLVFSFVFLCASAPANGTTMFMMYKNTVGQEFAKAKYPTYFIAQPLDKNTAPVFLSVDANSSDIKCAYAPEPFVASKWYTLSGVVRVS